VAADIIRCSPDDDPIPLNRRSGGSCPARGWMLRSTAPGGQREQLIYRKRTSSTAARSQRRVRGPRHRRRRSAEPSGRMYPEEDVIVQDACNHGDQQAALAGRAGRSDRADEVGLWPWWRPTRRVAIGSRRPRRRAGGRFLPATSLTTSRRGRTPTPIRGDGLGYPSGRSNGDPAMPADPGKFSAGFAEQRPTAFAVHIAPVVSPGTVYLQHQRRALAAHRQHQSGGSSGWTRLPSTAPDRPRRHPQFGGLSRNGRA